MEKTDEKLAALIEKLQEAGFANAPELLDGAVRAIHYDGIVSLWCFALFALLFIVSVVLIFISAAKNCESGVIIGSFGGVISLVAGIISGVGGNPWLETFDPQAALSQRIIGSIF